MSRRSSGASADSIVGAYRWRVTSRLLAALLGGYLLANAAAVLLARLLYRIAMSRADGVVTAVMISFLIYVGAVVWSFAARSATRAWLGLLSTAGICAVVAWLLSGGGGL